MMTKSFGIFLAFGWALVCLATFASSSWALTTVYNHGRCGQNSCITRGRFEADVLQVTPKPNYVLIYIGMNDVINDHFFTPLEKYIENVRWMIEQSRAAGITPVVCTIHHVVEEKVYASHPREKFTPETPNSKMDRYNAALKKLAAELGVAVADFNAVTGHTPQIEFLSNDGVHLTGSGNKLLAKTFWDLIGSQLQGRETIVCVGDSLTFGYQNQGAGTAEGETYPAMLKQLATAGGQEVETAKNAKGT
jgi:lysophospholipase L1-like esterase